MVRLRAGALVAAVLIAGGGVARADRPRVMVVPMAGDQVDPGLRQRVTRAVTDGLQDSGVEIVPPPADPSATAIAKAVGDLTGSTFVMRGTVEAEGRSYTFRLQMLDARSGAMIASREDRCEICTEAEALETANTSASTLKTQAFSRTPGANGALPAGGTGAGGVAGVSAGVGAGAGVASNLRVRVVVAEALDLPPSLDEFHGKIRAAIEMLIHDAGLGLAVPPPGSAARCTTRDCLKELALTVGATDVLAVSGSRNDVQGFALALELWNAARDEGAKSQGWCNFCTGPQMVTAAQDLGRPLLAQLAARAGATPPVVVAGTNLAPADGASSGRSSTRTVISWIGIGVGAAAVAAGVFLIAKGGDGTCTKVPGQTTCPNNYPSEGVGFAVAGVGLVAAGAGVWGLLATPSEPPASHARLDIGPGWLNLRGTF
jgi:hypothetical protein